METITYLSPQGELAVILLSDGVVRMFQYVGGMNPEALKMVIDRSDFDVTAYSDTTKWVTIVNYKMEQWSHGEGI